jgi:DNA-binding GntR family transcriptional regulator
MRNPALQERRNRQILADLVRAYIETGEPVSSRAISKRFEETLSTATIRNVMADLEDGGFLISRILRPGACRPRRRTVSLRRRLPRRLP